MRKQKSLVAVEPDEVEMEWTNIPFSIELLKQLEKDWSGPMRIRSRLLSDGSWTLEFKNVKAEIVDG